MIFSLSVNASIATHDFAGDRWYTGNPNFHLESSGASVIKTAIVKKNYSFAQRNAPYPLAHVYAEVSTSLIPESDAFHIWNDSVPSQAAGPYLTACLRASRRVVEKASYLAGSIACTLASGANRC